MITINHETLHSAMKRVGLREWISIDRYVSSNRLDYLLGICQERNYKVELMPLDVPGRV